jgi:copper oxidase (laccase) domain-containing protein
MYRLDSYNSKDLIYGFSEVSKGNLSFLYGESEDVINGRKDFLQKLDISPDETVAMFVKQGDIVKEVTKSDAGNLFNMERMIESDATITKEKNLALFLLVADCIPLIITDKDRSILSVVHVGIVNTKIGFPSKVVNNLKNGYNINPGNLEVIVGPSLQKDNFIYDYLEDMDSGLWRGFVEETDDGKLMIDNVGAVIKQLTDSGVKKENIYDCGIDTYTDDSFFSHKRDYDAGIKDKGRFAAVAMLL